MTSCRLTMSVTRQIPIIDDAVSLLMAAKKPNPDQIFSMALSW